MKNLAAIAAVLIIQAVAARGQPTQQCSLQSDYPSPLDGNGKPIGALVRVDLSSQVGVVLDDLPSAKRADVAQWLLSQGADYWKARAIRQMTLAYYRLNFRNYYVSNQGALPLPDPSLWTISVGTAKRAPYVSGKKKSVIDAVFVDYRMQTVILTDFNSPNASTGNRLNKPGDTVTMPFGLPLDPSLLLQRTGRACYDEYGYPRGSVDPGGEAWYFYDDTCTAKSAEPLDSAAFACNYCHCGFPRPTLDCVDALALKEGLVQPTFVFTRLPWSSTVADAYRLPRDLPPPVQGGADLVGFGPDLAKQREIYRYFAPDSCEMHERCIAADGGWRKLIMFNSTDINNGTRDLHIGAIPYVTSDAVPPPIIQHGDYVFDKCHGHYHFEHYGTFEYLDKQGNPAAGDQQKRGFCLIDLIRLANAEWSPLAIKYFDCKYQGITAGWADTYNIGIPCQWKDVTETPAGTYTLAAEVNPDHLLCEGALQCDANDEQIWDDTAFTTCSEGYDPEVCEVAQAARCAPQALDANGQPLSWANNPDEAPSTHRACGLSYVTDSQSIYGFAQEIGPLRDTEFSFVGNPNQRSDQLRGCTPGSSTTLKCTVPATSPTQVVRVCESSVALGCGTACRWQESLANVTVEPGKTVSVPFTCPAGRDGGRFGETGGAYSLYRAMAFGPDGSSKLPDVTCGP
jgi:hypothetical protein